MLSYRCSVFTIWSDLCRLSTFPWSWRRPSAGPTTASRSHTSSVTCRCDISSSGSMTAFIIPKEIPPDAMCFQSKTSTVPSWKLNTGCFHVLFYLQIAVTICDWKLDVSLIVKTTSFIYLHSFLCFEKRQVTLWISGREKTLTAFFKWTRFILKFKILFTIQRWFLACSSCRLELNSRVWKNWLVLFHFPDFILQECF